MKMATEFWHQTMFQYNWNRPLFLLTDRQRKSDEKRTGRTYTINFTFDNNLSQAFINYASAMNVSLLSLFLTSYYIFLFKLAPTETDLCVAMNVNSRYKSQLNHIIGPFMNL